MLPNATLTAVSRPGAIALNGDATANVSAWEGRARGYLMRDELKLTGPDEGTATGDVFVAELARARGLLSAVPRLVDLTVTIRDERTRPATVRTFLVRGAETAAAGTAADSLRLELEVAS